MALQEPLYVNRFITGLYENRSPLVMPFSFAGLTRIDRYDVIIDGLNCEVTPQNTVARRKGFQVWSPSLGAGRLLQNLYSWCDLNGNIRVVADLRGLVSFLSPTTKTDVYTSTSTDPFSFLGVGNFLFGGNGSDSFALKSGGTVIKFGITAPSTAPSITLSSGVLSPTVGYRWVYCFKNPNIPHISSASPLSGNPGPNTNKAFELVGERSSDPQVTKIEIYRTKDNGSIYYYVDEIDNPASGVWNYTDNKPDDQLDVQRIAPIAHENDPAPQGIRNLRFYAGRVWGSVGNLLYCAAGGDCVNGSGEFAWPPGNVWTFPQTITCLLPTRIGLLIFTRSNSYIMYGADLTTFYPMVYMENLGVANEHCAIMDTDILYVYTVRRQLVSISGTSFSDLAFPIANKLQASGDPEFSCITVHRNGVSSELYYACPNFYYKIDLGIGAWSTRAEPLMGCKLLKSIETSAGSYTLLLSTGLFNSYAYCQGSSYLDDTTTYNAWVQFGSIVLAPSSRVAILDSILLQRTSAGAQPDVYILTNETSGTFAQIPNPVVDPPELATSTTLISRRYDLSAVAPALSSYVQSLQFMVDFKKENAKNELLSFTLA